jgi:hypothetical protein
MSTVLKYYPNKKNVIKRLTELGCTEITLRYMKSEGWWLECDRNKVWFDDWVGMTIGDVMYTLEREWTKPEKI